MKTNRFILAALFISAAFSCQKESFVGSENTRETEAATIVAGEMNATIECTPLNGPFVVDFINKLEAGETFDKVVVNPEEGVFDCVGGIDCGSEAKPVTSILAADVIAERAY